MLPMMTEPVLVEHLKQQLSTMAIFFQFPGMGAAQRI
jgi:hypothetical protein